MCVGSKPSPRPAPQQQQAPQPEAPQYKTVWILGSGPVKIPINDSARAERSRASTPQPSSSPSLPIKQHPPTRIVETIEVPGKKEPVRYGGDLTIGDPEGTKRSKGGTKRAKKKGLGQFDMTPSVSGDPMVMGMGSQAGLNIPV